MSTVYHSREITIGKLRLGGRQPVFIQSMANTPTMDTETTVAQIIRLTEAGCELVRITAANVKEAENLKNIRKGLQKMGVDIPLIADIHFQPKAAEVAAGIVEKVRINPGNYSGSHHKAKKYSEAAYRKELDETAKNLKPLLNICKHHGTAIRIGINHGSLSDRILYKYGNTAEGLVASAMEFIRICRKNGFEKLIISLKSSDVQTMIGANRLMVREMQKQGMDYPLHLGVTEAGNGAEGRIKSAMGIGTLLAEGIGDAIRVSLTEVPEKEIPVARRLVELYGRRATKPDVKAKIQYLKSGEIPGHQRSAVAFFDVTKNFPEETAVILLSYPGLQAEDLVLCVPVDFNLAYGNKKADGLLIANGPSGDNRHLRGLALEVLQARGLRYSKTEFVACPSCGRTLFDIEKVLEKVKKRLGNIKGLKIAVMGCLVNGPGEMAGADYGFVGAAPGKVNLYKSEKILFGNLPEEEALDRLEELIRER
ncbi:MAG: hypothetical protein IEMM0006_0281 [bacterium]|nr:MAG: hypothetical protein IEMM0006_0281 [bacterium]